MSEKVATTTCNNPSLSEEPRNQRIKVAPPATRESLLSWLESSGRLYSSEEVDEIKDYRMAEDLNDFLEPEVYSLEDEDEEAQL